MDRRLTLANHRVAYVDLRGQVDAPEFVGSEAAEVVVPLADLLAEPGGARERQILLGDGFEVIERFAGFAFGRCRKDGYCGYLPEAALGPPSGVSHWVAAPATHLYPESNVRARETAALSFGARLRVLGQSGAFAETPHGFVPVGHLQALGTWFSDPVEVAGLFLGTPYLWGGNSREGLDCSGLVQAALLACGRPCPGDSDLQQALGVDVPEGAPLQRGDLLFWKGHVAMMIDARQMIHATGHFMSVVTEDADAAIARIRDQTGSDVAARRRI